MDRYATVAAPHTRWGEGARRLGASSIGSVPVAFAASAAFHGVALGVLLVVAPILSFVVPLARPGVEWLIVDEEPEIVPLEFGGGAGGTVRQEAPAPEVATPARELTTPSVPTEILPGAAPSAPVEPGEGRAAGQGGAGTGAGGPAPAAAERLRPALRDARLWAPLDRAVNELTAEQRLELELAGRIEEWQDSVAAALAVESGLTDWTRTDSQGRKWGISPGVLHLGGLTLPLPFSFATPIGMRDVERERQWEWREITRAAATGAVHDSWKDRAKAIRERRDRERAQAKPDTTRIR